MLLKSQVPPLFYIESDKLILIFIWKYKETKICKVILKKKNQVGRIYNTFYYFKTLYKAAVIKALNLGIKKDI